MALGDFFRINMPYGIKKNINGQWFAFNREYMPIGWNSMDFQENINDDSSYSKLPIHTVYKGVTEKFLLKLAGDEKYVRRDDNNDIHLVFLYDDKSNPKHNAESWPDYFQKIKLLSSLEEKAS